MQIRMNPEIVTTMLPIKIIVIIFVYKQCKDFLNYAFGDKHTWSGYEKKWSSKCNILQYTTDILWQIVAFHHKNNIIIILLTLIPQKTYLFWNILLNVYTSISMNSLGSSGLARGHSKSFANKEMFLWWAFKIIHH